MAIGKYDVEPRLSLRIDRRRAARKDCRIELFLGLEMIMQQGLSDSSLLRDLSHARALVAVRGEDPLRGIKDGFDG